MKTGIYGWTSRVYNRLNKQILDSQMAMIYPFYIVDIVANRALYLIWPGQLNWQCIGQLLRFSIIMGSNPGKAESIIYQHLVLNAKNTEPDMQFLMIFGHFLTFSTM